MQKFRGYKVRAVYKKARKVRNKKACKSRALNRQRRR